MNTALLYTLIGLWPLVFIAVWIVCCGIADGQRPIHDIVRDAERRAARSRR